MERLTDPAQGYCEMYCKKYGHCFGDPGDCIFEKEIAMYDALKSIEGIVPFDRLLELALADKEDRLVVLPAKTVWELTLDAGPDCDMKCPVDVWDEALGCDFCGKAKLFAYERPCTQERLKELGKTVFLTREEAEAALAGEGGKHETD